MCHILSSSNFPTFSVPSKENQGNNILSNFIYFTREILQTFLIKKIKNHHKKSTSPYWLIRLLFPFRPLEASICKSYSASTRVFLHYWKDATWSYSRVCCARRFRTEGLSFPGGKDFYMHLIYSNKAPPNCGNTVQEVGWLFFFFFFFYTLIWTEVKRGAARMENHYLILSPFPPNRKEAKQENKLVFISAAQLLIRSL